MSDITQGILKEYTDKGLEGIKKRLGDKWDSFTNAQRQSAERAARRVVKLDIDRRLGKDVVDQLRFVKVTIGEFEIASKIAIADIFWEEMNKTLESLGSFLAGVGKGLIPGL